MSSINLQFPFPFPTDVLNILSMDLPIKDQINLSEVCKQGKKITDHTLALRAKEYGCPPSDNAKKFLSTLFKISKSLLNEKFIPESSGHFKVEKKAYCLFFTKTVKALDCEQTLLNIAKSNQVIAQLYSHRPFYRLPDVQSLHSFLLKCCGETFCESLDLQNELTKACSISIQKKDAVAAQLLLKLGAKATSPVQSNLLQALSQGMRDTALLLLKHGAPVDDVDPNNGRFPIHSAAMWGYNEIIEALLKLGAPVDAQSKYKETPLHEAIQAKNIDTTLLLLSKKANPNNTSIYGETPLSKAIFNNEVEEIILSLLECGANTSGHYMLHWAAKTGKIKIIKALLSKGVEINALAYNQQTPLFFAVMNEKIDAVKLLLEAKADPNIADIDGDTPLRWSSQEGLTEIAILLLKHGAKPNLSSNNDHAPLHWAVYSKSKELIQELLIKGAEIDALGSNNQTPLFFAVQLENLNCVKILLENGADPDIPDTQGTTPVALALTKKRYDLVNAILDYNTLNIRALDLTIHKGSKE